MPKRFPKSPDKEQRRMANLCDEVAEFQDYRQDVLKHIRQLIRSGKTKEEIMADPVMAAQVAARRLTIALTSENEGAALAAIKDIEDRRDGKAIERKELKHTMSQLPDEQLDALLLSKLQGNAALLVPAGDDTDN